MMMSLYWKKNKQCSVGLLANCVLVWSAHKEYGDNNVLVCGIVIQSTYMCCVPHYHPNHLKAGFAFFISGLIKLFNYPLK